ncbi:MAG TPA: NUDIX domain-containing protein [Candidatus Nanoarchaeia archaeon]|nr:NUDIX domain-containing protein [Candidatus Nanoarchaeia archaeon]
MVKLILGKDIEYIVHCDKSGNIIGPISKNQAHLPGIRPFLTHYSTWSMIFHAGSGKYGIQLKNPKKLDEFGAGKWDMGAAGHNCYIKDKNGYRPMDFKETLIKEVDEEIGLKIKVIDPINEFVKLSKTKIQRPIAIIIEKFHYKTERNNEFVGLGFILTPTTKVKFKDNEVVAFKWLTPKELTVHLKKENNYCDPLPLVFKKAENFRKRYLS